MKHQPLANILVALWGVFVLVLAAGMQAGGFGAWSLPSWGHSDAPYFGAGTPAALLRIPLLFLFLLAMATGFIGWGRIGLRITGNAGKRGLLAACASVVLGAGMQGAVLFGLALAGLFYPATIWAVAVCGFISGIGAWRKGDFRGALKGVGVPPWWFWIPAFLLAGRFLPYILCPVTDQDSLLFHLGLQGEFLLAHRACFPALGMTPHMHFPFPFEANSAIALAAGNDTVPVLLNLVFLLSGAGFAFYFADSRAGRKWGWAAVLAVMASHVMVTNMPRAKGDIPSLACLIGALALLGSGRVRMQGGKASGGTALAFLLLGLSITGKYTNGISALFLVPALLYRRGTAGFPALMVLGVLPLAPWGVKEWLATGDPVYPFLPDGLVPKLEWSADNTFLLGAHNNYFRMDAGLAGAGLLALPLSFVLCDYPVLLFLLPAGLACLLRNRGIFIEGVCLAGGVLITMQATGIARLQSGPAILAGVWLCSLGGRSAGIAGVAVFALATAILPPPTARLGIDDRPRHGNPWPYLLGGQDRGGFLASRLGAYQDLRERLEGLVPAGRRILLFHDIRRLGLGRPALVGRLFYETPLMWSLAGASRDTREFGKKLRQLNAGALVENFTMAMTALSEKHPFDWNDRQLGVYRSFGSGRLRVAWQSGSYDSRNGGYRVYVLERAGGNRPACLPSLPGTEETTSAAGLHLMALGAGSPTPDAVRRMESEYRRQEARLAGVGSLSLETGRFYWRVGRNREAGECFRRALDCGVVDCRMLVRLGIMEMETEPARATEWFRAAEGVSPAEAGGIFREEMAQYGRTP